jgi:hypothetical protein
MEKTTNSSDPTPQQKNGEVTNLWGLLDKVVTTRTALISILLLLIGLLSSIYFLGQIGVKRIGDVIVFTDFKGKTITHNFATSQLWDKINYPFEKGKTLTIDASGWSYTAIHHLVEYGHSDTARFVPWSNPDGLNNSVFTRGADIHRRKFCIMPTQNYGSLIARVHFKESNRDSVIFLGSHQKLNHLSEDVSSIEFAVNEPELDLSKKDAYIVPKDIDPSYYAAHFMKGKKDIANDVWKKISLNPYLKTLWFDDNIGNFLITIEVN